MNPQQCIGMRRAKRRPAAPCRPGGLTTTPHNISASAGTTTTAANHTQEGSRDNNAEGDMELSCSDSDSEGVWGIGELQPSDNLGEIMAILARAGIKPDFGGEDGEDGDGFLNPNDPSLPQACRMQ